MLKWDETTFAIRWNGAAKFTMPTPCAVGILILVKFVLSHLLYLHFGPVYCACHVKILLT